MIVSPPAIVQSISPGNFGVFRAEMQCLMKILRGCQKLVDEIRTAFAAADSVGEYF
jgi:hypothetical protein